MCELHKILKKIELDSLISYFMSESDLFQKEIADYEKIIKKSYDSIIDKLVNMLAADHLQENSLFDMVTDFAKLHDDIYFEIGMLIGFQLYKNMERGYKTFSENEKQIDFDLDSSLIKTGKGQSLLNDLFRVRSKTVLEEAIRKDTKYQEVDKKSYLSVKQIDKIELNKEEWMIIDKALSASNERSSEYGRVAYCLGFMDAVVLLT